MIQKEKKWKTKYFHVKLSEITRSNTHIYIRTRVNI